MYKELMSLLTRPPRPSGREKGTGLLVTGCHLSGYREAPGATSPSTHKFLGIFFTEWEDVQGFPLKKKSLFISTSLSSTTNR